MFDPFLCECGDLIICFYCRKNGYKIVENHDWIADNNLNKKKENKMNINKLLNDRLHDFNSPELNNLIEKDLKTTIEKYISELSKKSIVSAKEQKRFIYNYKYDNSLFTLKQLENFFSEQSEALGILSVEPSYTSIASLKIRWKID